MRYYMTDTWQNLLEHMYRHDIDLKPNRQSKMSDV